MSEEVSQRSGPKPYILAPMGDELLCHYFFGKTREQTAKVADESNDFEILSDDDDTENDASAS